MSPTNVATSSIWRCATMGHAALRLDVRIGFRDLDA